MCYGYAWSEQAYNYVEWKHAYTYATSFRTVPTEAIYLKVTSCLVFPMKQVRCLLASNSEYDTTKEHWTKLWIPRFGIVYGD